MTQTRRWMLAAGAAGAALPAAAQQPADITPTPERPILLLDQVRSAPFPAELAPVFQPMKRLEEVEAALKANNIAFRRGVALFDTRTARPDLVKLIAGLPRGEIYIVPEGREVAFSVVVRAITVEAAARVLQPPPPQARPGPARPPRRDRPT